MTLEAMAQAWPALARTLPAEAARVRVVVFRSQSDFSAYRTSPFEAGTFVPGADHDTIVTLAAPEKMERVLRHEFVHWAHRLTGAPLPRWLEEGVAEYYSLLELGGKLARIGLPPKPQWELLKEGQWLTVGELFPLSAAEAVGRNLDPGVYYANAWVVAWVLLENGYAAVDRYRAEVRRGLTPEPAFEAAFGRSWVKALSEAQARFGAGAMKARDLGWAPEPLEAPRALGPVSEEDATLALADLALAAGRWEQADRLYAGLKRRAGGAGLATGLGLLALKRGRRAEARVQLQRAVELGAAGAEAWFELAMLEREGGAAGARVFELLDEACRRNPGHAEARFMRARQRGGAAALEDLRAAAALKPQRTDFWREVAAAELAAGRRAEAREAALRALETSGTLQDTEQARGILRQAESVAAAAAKPAPPVTTPQGWEPPGGDSSFEGRLLFIDCAGATVKFQVKSEVKSVVVYSAQPGRITLRGGTPAQREFNCGPQKGLTVVVEYNARPGRSAGVDGEVVAIEFR
jgi:tetratricopeptide (TPR) repeat protein